MDVLKAINAVSLELSKTGIGKDSQNKEQNYRYRGIDAYLNSLSPLLAKHGLVVVPLYTSCESTEVAKTKSGAPILQSKVVGEFDLFAVSDQSKVTAIVAGEGRDSADKAANKAMSVAYKYMAAQVFCIPFVGMEDPEDDSGGSGGEPEINLISPERVDEMIAKINATTDIEALRQFYDANAAELSTDEAAYAKVFAATKARRAKLKAA